jgi:hypothetical protein
MENGHNSGPADGPPEPADDHLENLRRMRISEYMKSSLAKKDPLQALLGAMNCGLMRTGIGLEGAIDHAIGDRPMTINLVQTLMPAFDTQLRVSRLSERLAILDLRVTAQQKKSPPGTTGCGQ